MEVQYTGHPQTDVKVDFSKEDFAEVDSLMRQAFLDHLQYGVFEKSSLEYLRDSNRARIVQLCEKFGVDWEYTKDRVSFFKAVLAVK